MVWFATGVKSEMVACKMQVKDAAAKQAAVSASIRSSAIDKYENSTNKFTALRAAFSPYR